MGEWRRVFCDPKRLFLLALMALVCVGLFVLSLLDEIGSQGLSTMRAGALYEESLVRRWQNEDMENLAQLAVEEEGRLEDFLCWVQGSTWRKVPYETEEEAYASVADLPALLDAAKSGDQVLLNRIATVYEGVLRTMKEEAEYLTGYGDYLDGVQSQAEKQSQTSLFGKPGSFSRRNLAKTAREFKALQGVEVSFGSNRGLENFIAFDLGDYFHLIAMILFVFAFLEERRKGLWSVVRTAPGGRTKLAVRRIGILCAASVLATVLFQILPLVTSLGISGGWDGLGRSLQSLESFRTCTLPLTIAQWLGLYFATKVLCGIFIGLILWCVLGFLSNIQFSLSVLGVVLVVEYVLYAFLPVQSGLNIFKYFNLFNFVHSSVWFTDYLNVNLFGFPVGIRELALWTAAVLGVIFLMLNLLLHRFRRPEGNRDLLGKISQWLNRVLDFFRSRFSLGLWEVYKSGVFQYGILILLIVLYAAGNLSYVGRNSQRQNYTYLAYVQDAEGPVDETTDEYLSCARDNIIPGSENAFSLEEALSLLEGRVAELRARGQERGFQPWVVDDTGYRLIYGRDGQEKQRLNAAAAMILLLFCCGGVAAFERQSGVVPMVRSTQKGRKGLFRRKLLLAFALTLFVWAAVYTGEIKALFAQYHFNPQSLFAPVQNIDQLSRFPLGITLVQYLALLYALRFVMLLGVAFTALWISHLTPSVQTSYLVSAGVLGLPAILTVLGVDLLKWISPLVPVSSAELLWSLGSGNALSLLPWLIWAALGLIALILCGRKWIRT